MLSKTTPPSSDALHLHFLTPTRIKHNREYLFFKNRDPLSFQVFIENLYRRLYCLAFFHCEPFADAFSLPQTRDVRLTDSQLSWLDWERFSNRQQQRMRLGGFVGQIDYAGPWQTWWPLIQAGEYLHVGKATAFGLGQFQIMPGNQASSSPARHGSETILLRHCGVTRKY